MRRITFAAVLGAVVLVSTPAAAQTQELYPPEGEGQLCAISDLTPVSNQNVRIETARGFAPGQEASVFIAAEGADPDDKFLGNLDADGDGSVSGTVTVPGDAVAGRNFIEVTGGDEAAQRTFCVIPVNVLSDTVQAPDRGGVLAVTGADSFRWMAAAMMLIGASVGLKMFERRRREAIA